MEKFSYFDQSIAIYNDLFETGDIWLEERVVHENAQNWMLHLDETDSTVAFENIHWRGFYLGADDDVHGWLELKSQKKIRWTVDR